MSPPSPPLQNEHLTNPSRPTHGPFTALATPLHLPHPECAPVGPRGMAGGRGVRPTTAVRVVCACMWDCRCGCLCRPLSFFFSYESTLPTHCRHFDINADPFGAAALPVYPSSLLPLFLQPPLLSPPPHQVGGGRLQDTRCQGAQQVVQYEGRGGGREAGGPGRRRSHPPTPTHAFTPPPPPPLPHICHTSRTC